MKKAIIGLVFAAFVFGSCELQKGGTIKVENTENATVTIYITKGLTDGLLTPPTNVVKEKSIAANGSGEISIDEDGTYYVRAFYPDPLVGALPIPGTVKPMAMVNLLAGNTVSVTAEK